MAPARPGEAEYWLSAEASHRLIEAHLERRKRAIEQGREPENLPSQEPRKPVSSKHGPSKAARKRATASKRTERPQGSV